MSTEDEKFFRTRAQILLEKLDKNLDTSSSQEIKKHQNTLQELLKLERDTNETYETKKYVYASLLQKTTELSKQIDIQKQESKKMTMKIQSRMETANKKFMLLFQKLKKERENSQDQIKIFLDTNLNSLLSLSNHNNTDHNFENLLKISYSQELKQLLQLQQQIEQFFQSSKDEENKLKKQFFKSFEKIRQYLQQENDRGQVFEVQIFLKQVHEEITQKIKLLRGKRQKMEEDILNLLENVFNIIGFTIK